MAMTIEGKGAITVTAQDYMNIIFKIEKNQEEIIKRLDLILLECKKSHTEQETEEKTATNGFIDGFLNNVINDIQKNMSGATNG